MTNLRKLAKGKSCQIRLIGVCSGNPEETVLAHFRLAGISGMSIKPPDLLGAWACAGCHGVVDVSKDPTVQLAFAHGVLRTQAALLKLGAIK